MEESLCTINHNNKREYQPKTLNLKQILENP